MGGCVPVGRNVGGVRGVGHRVGDGGKERRGYREGRKEMGREKEEKRVLVLSAKKARLLVGVRKERGTVCALVCHTDLSPPDSVAQRKKKEERVCWCGCVQVLSLLCGGIGGWGEEALVFGHTLLPTEAKGEKSAQLCC